MATLLDLSGVAARAGDHCCQPLMNALGLDGTVRLSAHVYNTEDEIDQAAGAVAEAVESARAMNEETREFLRRIVHEYGGRTMAPIAGANREADGDNPSAATASTSRSGWRAASSRPRRSPRVPVRSATRRRPCSGAGRRPHGDRGREPRP
jgi:hypothetical protein